MARVQRRVAQPAPDTRLGPSSCLPFAPSWPLANNLRDALPPPCNLLLAIFHAFSISIAYLITFYSHSGA